VTEQSGYGAFQKIAQFYDNDLVFVSYNFKGQYSFSNRNTLANFDVADNPNAFGGLDFNPGATCNSTKLSENTKELYEYKLYDQNGAYITSIDGSVNSNLPAVKFEYQNTDYIWADLLNLPNSPSVDFFNKYFGINKLHNIL
jgi:hypothetical protein